MEKNFGDSTAIRQNGSADLAAPDSPIDLSQLSTRYRSVDLSSRSVSESCLAPAAAKKRRIQGFKDPLPPPPTTIGDNQSADLLKYRSMSHADIAGYRTPWLSGDLLPESGKILQQPKTSAPEKKTTASPSSSSAAESLKFRCMSDSRLAGNNVAFPPAASTSGRKNFMSSNSDLLRAATDNSQLEFLLRRTASESFLPSR